jgi:hypothetical protein
MPYIGGDFCGTMLMQGHNKREEGRCNHESAKYEIWRLRSQGANLEDMSKKLEISLSLRQKRIDFSNQ